MIHDDRELLISQEERRLRLSLPPGTPDDVIGGVATGCTIIAAALALTLDGDPAGADHALKTDLVGGDDTSPTLYAVQIALGLSARAVEAAEVGGRVAAIASLRQATAIFRELADRCLSVEGE